MRSQENNNPSHSQKKDRCLTKYSSVVLVFVFGMTLGWLTTIGCVSAKKELDLALILQAWDIIQRQYVDQAAVKPTAATYGALSGMVDALGDTGHSTFLSPEMVKRLKEVERGKLKGIGAEIQLKDGHVVIVTPLDNSPAQKARLHPGDIILKVDGQDISDWPLSQVVERISGPAGTWVTLTIREARTERTRQIAVMRAEIKLNEVTWQLLPGTSIAHLRLASFDADVTKDFRKVLAEIREAAGKGIILDLRNNPGGLINEAVGVASQFLEGGNVLLVKDAKDHITPMPVKEGGLAPKIPLIVLINEGTASAGEIVAGALQERHRAILVGEKTFGTGTVLQQFGLFDGSAMLLAVEEWLTPDGHSFWHKGIVPKVAVALPANATPLLPETERAMTPEQLQSSDDRQLLRALELLNPSTLSK